MPFEIRLDSESEDWDQLVLVCLFSKTAAQWPLWNRLGHPRLPMVFCESVFIVSLLEVGQLDRNKALIDFDNGQIVMAGQLSHSISAKARLVSCPRTAVVRICQQRSEDSQTTNQ